MGMIVMMIIMTITTTKTTIMGGSTGGTDGKNSEHEETKEADRKFHSRMNYFLSNYNDLTWMLMPLLQVFLPM
jgi:hypothetical protein